MATRIRKVSTKYGIVSVHSRRDKKRQVFRVWIDYQGNVGPVRETFIVPENATELKNGAGDCFAAETLCVKRWASRQALVVD